MYSKLAIIFGFLTLAVPINQIVYADESLDILCNDQPVSLESISKTRRLIGENERNPLKICDRYKESFAELDHILSLVQSGNICNLEFVNEVRNYHMKFIYMNEVSHSKQADKIPKSLRLFFITLCFQISAQCKMTLINNLEQDTKGIINEEDYEQIELLEKHGATLLNKETQIADFDDILLLGDLNTANEDQSEVQETRMSILVQTSGVLRQLTSVCKHKFRPFYERSIMPLVKLSHLGYNYQGELLEREIEELKKNQFIKRWYNIVQLCESLNMIRIYQNTDKTDEASGVITFIGNEQEASMRAQNLKPIDEEESVGTIIKPPEREEHLEDILWIKSQDELNELIQKYQATASEADRIRDKMVWQVLNKMKALLTSGKVFMFASELIACTKRDECEIDKQSINLDMLQMIDEVVEKDAIEKGTMEESTEKAVSWSGRAGSSWFGGTGDSGVTTRRGMNSRKSRQYPSKPSSRKKVVNYTSWWTTAKRGLRALRPSKLSLASWLLGIMGTLLIFVCIVAHG